MTLIWKDRIEICKYIIKDRVNSDNIDEILNEFENYAKKNSLEFGYGKEIHNILLDIKNSNN